MAVEEEDDVVVRMINSAVVLRSDTLDLSKKRISELPQEILNLKDLESLHLEGNYIKELPDDFFDKLTNLKWLDLRNNRLESLPTSVGKHRCLRSLLLENNSLTHLPCELGFVNALCGLHLSGNPLEFPPSQIVEKGTQEVLQYLREMCNNNSQEWPEERLSRASDEESEDLRMSGDEWYPENMGYSQGSRESNTERNAWKTGAFKLPPIFQNATVVRRSSTGVSDARNSVQGQTATKFEPIRRGRDMTTSLPETSPRKARVKRKSYGGFLEKVLDSQNEEVMEEARSMAHDNEVPEKSFTKIIKKKRNVKKRGKTMPGDVIDRNLPPLVSDERPELIVADEKTRSVGFSVGDMIAIKVEEKHHIRGQPCVGKVITDVDERGLVLVHYYVGTYDGEFRPMMSRSSPYLRKVPLDNIVCKFDMQADGRLSPSTAIRIKQLLDRPD